MINRVTVWFGNHEKILLFLLVLAFLLIRLPGTGLPLHQDEYKWPSVVNPANTGSTIPHPPLGEFIYRVAGYIVGFDTHFRLIPVFFGALNFLLLYYLMRFLFGRKEAVIASLLWILSYFSVLASLMVDTDGEIIPFFFLLALIGYYKSKANVGKGKYIWFGLMVLSFILGFFIKVSFILAIGAIVADFLWERRSFITKRDALKYLGYGLGGIVILAILLIISQYVFSFFDLTKSLMHWNRFVEFDRNWFQTLIQVIKALLYTSPFLLAIPLFLNRKDLERLRPFLFYIIFGMFFYVILFDFSIGALDRYLQFLIVPLCALSAAAIKSVTDLRNDAGRNRLYLFWGCIVGLCLILTLFLPHIVPPLHPKAAWISRVLSLKWNFLYPFSGGSGPLGFYVSFLFMALTWIISVILIAIGFIKSHLRMMILLILIPIGLAYNGVFIQEYLFGGLYGSASELVGPAVDFIKNDQKIKRVIVYNDNAGNEIQATHKYERRLYIDPMFESDIQVNIDYLNTHKEHYFVLDIPRFDPQSIYQKYFNTCKIIYDQRDKTISAKIYDCTQAPNLKI